MSLVRTLTLAAVLTLAAAAPALGGEPLACRTVHGRMSLWNGAPTVRIWIVGTRRMLGVRQPNDSLEDLPPNVRRLWATHGDAAMWESELFGDFRVCPLAPDRPGHMQPVRLESASRLVLRPRR